MSLKPLVLYSNGPSPNPVKVAIVLEELGLEYEARTTPYETIKAEPFISLNPNGRLPALEDPNTGITLFESGAILEYLVENYDKENKLHYATGPEKWLQLSWLHFQTSGQGPYFGQLAWFSMFHPEKNITSAIDRYTNEIKRVSGVIDAHLKKQGTAYLLGDHAIYADLAWIPWFRMATMFLIKDWEYKTELPVFSKWFDALNSRPAVVKTVEKPEFQRK